MLARAWSPQQAKALDQAGAWLDQCRRELGRGTRLSKQIFRLFGFAGTGKTTLARHLAEGAETVCYGAFTGKAALMMQRNGCAGASTIHSLIYIVDDYGGSVTFIRNHASAAKDADLIVIDECSMVGPDIAADLLSFGRPILVLGDPAQLPPVNGAGYFTNAEPDAMLTEIHRQAADNPIIRMATLVREGGVLERGTYGKSRVVARGTLENEEVLSASQVLVGMNMTRRGFNAKIRRLLGRSDELPEEGDRLVCLRNDKTCGIFNGGLFTVLDVVEKRRSPAFTMMLASDDFPNREAIKVKVRREMFTGGFEDLDREQLRGTQQFDYGYALTCHKAQGSQWPDVIVYDESRAFREDAGRWLYTAITRASDQITVVS